MHVRAARRYRHTILIVNRLALHFLGTNAIESDRKFENDSGIGSETTEYISDRPIQSGDDGSDADDGAGADDYAQHR